MPRIQTIFIVLLLLPFASALPDPREWNSPCNASGVYGGGLDTSPDGSSIYVGADEGGCIMSSNGMELARLPQASEALAIPGGVVLRPGYELGERWGEPSVVKAGMSGTGFVEIQLSGAGHGPIASSGDRIAVASTSDVRVYDLEGVWQWTRDDIGSPLDVDMAAGTVVVTSIVVVNGEDFVDVRAIHVVNGSDAWRHTYELWPGRGEIHASAAMLADGHVAVAALVNDNAGDSADDVYLRFFTQSGTPYSWAVLADVHNVCNVGRSCNPISMDSGGTRYALLTGWTVAIYDIYATRSWRGDWPDARPSALDLTPDGRHMSYVLTPQDIFSAPTWSSIHVRDTVLSTAKATIASPYVDPFDAVLSPDGGGIYVLGPLHQNGGTSLSKKIVP